MHFIDYFMSSLISNGNSDDSETHTKSASHIN